MRKIHLVRCRFLPVCQIKSNMQNNMLYVTSVTNSKHYYGMETPSYLWGLRPFPADWHQDIVWRRSRRGRGGAAGHCYRPAFSILARRAMKVIVTPTNHRCLTEQQKPPWVRESLENSEARSAQLFHSCQLLQMALNESGIFLFFLICHGIFFFTLFIVVSTFPHIWVEKTPHFFFFPPVQK